MTCNPNPDGTVALTWRAAAATESASPYQGRFEETGEMTVRRDFQNFELDILSLRADFTVESATGQVSGTKRLAAPVADVAGSVVCGEDFIVDHAAIDVPYSATVTTTQGVFGDRGTARHGFIDQGPNPAASTDLREDLTSALSVPEQQPSVLFGKRTPGGSFSAMSANTKRASPFVSYFPSTVRRIHAFIDGKGATSGSQTVRAVLYRRDPANGGPGAYVTRSFEYTVPAGMSARWVPFWLTPIPRLEPGVYWVGLQTGGDNGVARYAWDSSTAARRYNIDGFADGASDPFGTSFSDNQQMSIFAFGNY